MLSRARLLTLLDELMENRLIILAAPAGYGKTSLLVDFAYTTAYPVCWYALDALDSEPLRFIAHFIAAISQRFPKFGQSCTAALRSMSQDNLDLDLLASLVINDAYDTITEHFVLVLDDFHLVENSRPVVNFVNRFIQDVDENCHLVLASRMLLTLPDLPLMVARSQVSGLSFEELVFQPDEIQELLRQNYNMNLSQTEAEELARDTEGWVTGLLLSTQVMGRTIANRQRVARVSGVGLYEYLAQQVLAQQPEEVQVFLMRASLLEEFDARLCEEVIGKALGIETNWFEIMDATMRSNLFILPVGEDGQSLRFHHLFQDFLRDRINRDRPAEARLIQLRLAEVHAAREDWERAYAIYKRLDDTEQIVRLVERAGSSMIVHGRLLTLTDWLDSLPADLFNRNPALISLKATVAYESGDCDRGIKLLDQAIAGLRFDRNGPLLAQTLYRRSVAHRFTGQYQLACQDVDEALALLAEDHGDAANQAVYADALVGKAIALSFLGRASESLALLQQALVVYQRLADEQAAAKVWLEIGRISKALGRYGDAEVAYRRSLDYYQATGNLVWQANLYNNLGVLQHSGGDYVTATSSFERAIHYAKIGGSPRLEAYALTSIGDLYQELEAAQEALEAYRQARDVAQRVQDGYLKFYLNLAEAHLKRTLAEVQQADELLASAMAMAEARGSQYERNSCRLEAASFALARGCGEEAAVQAREALEFFVREGYEGEIPRARLVALLVFALSGFTAEAAEQAALLRPCLSDPEKLKVLIAAGRDLKTPLADARSAGELSELVEILLEQVERHESGIPALRRQIRRQAVIVPFAPPKMIIRTLGKTQVKVSDRQVTSSDWQVQTARDLFLLLLAHPEGLTKEEIGEIFWPDSSLSELKLRFKNTIYRLRHAAGKDVILFQGESLYLFNREMDYEYDVESFLKEIALAEKAEMREQKETHLANAVRLYRGPYLVDVDESWAVAERERLLQVYMNALLQLANLSLEAKEFDKAIEHVQAALKQDICLEDAHRTAMRVYHSMGNRALIIRQYDQCRQALEDELGVPPSTQTKKLYDSLIQ